MNRLFLRMSQRFLVVLLLLLAVTLKAPAASNEQVIYRFQGGTDGYDPNASLLVDRAGNLYGTTVEGGSSGTCGQNQSGCGIVFQLTPPAHQGDPWVETVIYRFAGGSDGYAPTSALVADKKGNLYGTTAAGGVQDNGTIFGLERPSVPGAKWIHRVLYDFRGISMGSNAGDGAQPSGVVFDKAGNLYGMTRGGGFCIMSEEESICYGTVFELAAPKDSGGPWTESVIYRFAPSGDSNPHSRLIFDNSGNLYATTYLGGAYGLGGVFELTPPSVPGAAWTEKSLYDFSFPDGGAPNDSLVFDQAANLFGTTLIGGAANMGTVFELSPPVQPGASWTETVLHSFQESGDGNAPLANVIFFKGDNLLGTAWMGGEFKQGTVFRLTPPSGNEGWTESTVHNFGSGDDGQQPAAGLVVGPDGALYGTTTTGGSKPTDQCMLDNYAWTCGVVFRIGP